ncbi:hypothetical protein ACJRO7_005323 [Eucalyptus globulus]|uniref:Uncharacterized protein n=1 Tax=Eucalyptus globulus TaxID=34317 RepID=A0ABD3IZB6_EUCGL
MQTRVKDAKVKLARIHSFSLNIDRPKPRNGRGGSSEPCTTPRNPSTSSNLERPVRGTRPSTWPLAALVSKCKLWRDLSILVSKMEELCNDQFLKGEAEDKSKKKPASSSSHANVPWQGQKFARLTSYWDRQAPTNFSCREDEKKKIIEWLKAETYTQISIGGEQGTGKTFLARWAYSQAKYVGYKWRA